MARKEFPITIPSTLEYVFHVLEARKWGILSALVVIGFMRLWQLETARRIEKRRVNVLASDPGLLKKHTTYQSYETPTATYPRIRTFYKQQQQVDQLPKDVPLLVFTHGIGGSIAQFIPLLTSLINVASCLAIDLPGCGASTFEPDIPEAYTTHALAELVAAAIDKYRDVTNNQKVVLIGHSMGCSINAVLASSTSPLASLLHGLVAGTVAICPTADLPTPGQIANIRGVTSLPIFVFDVMRWVDRRGGLKSPSVTRVVGPDGDEETRKLQMKFNEQSRSEVFFRMTTQSLDEKGLPGKDIWSGVKVPLFLVAAESDKITAPTEVEQITSWLSHEDRGPDETSDETSTPAVPTTTGDTTIPKPETKSDEDEEPLRAANGSIIKDDQTSSKHEFVLKTTVFPSPAAHALPYSPTTVRILAGMIENFLEKHIDKRLGRGWQLQHLTTSGKWDVKNLKKWQSVDPCSKPIGGIFRAMKTMREVDDEHCPKVFAKHYSADVLDDGVAMVVDISHESPVYNPQGLEDAGIEYHKFPTVSKMPPSAEEVEHFIALIDRLRQSPKLQPHGKAHPLIGVHCHYGFNRTGVLIICYLVERADWKLHDAIEEFKQKRPPGIKHDHFLNELYVRYAVKMERRATIVG